MTGPTRAHLGWLATGAVATGARLLYLLAATDPAAADSDARHYHEIAGNLAAGHGFTSTYPQVLEHATAFRPPLYPALLALVYRFVGPSVTAGKLANVAIGVAVVLLTGRLVASRCGRREGWIAGGLVALYPPLIANDVNLLTEPLTLLLLVLLAGEVSGRRRWWLIGIETAALALTRPSALLLAVPVAIFVWQQVGVRRALACLALVALCLLPWSARNHVQVGTWGLTTSNGFNLAAMYSPPAQERHAFVDLTADPWFEDHRLSQFDEALWDAELLAIGRDGIRRSPQYVGLVAARNTAALTEVRPWYNDDAERMDGRNLTIRSLSLPLFYVVSALGIWGLWRGRRNPAVAFLAVSGAYFVAVSLVTIAAPRLRAPADLACCVGAALVLAGARRARADPLPADPLPADRLVAAPDAHVGA